MYCKYENKYKLWRDLWITVVKPAPPHCYLPHVLVMKEWRTNDVLLPGVHFLVFGRSLKKIWAEGYCTMF